MPRSYGSLRARVPEPNVLDHVVAFMRERFDGDLTVVEVADGVHEVATPDALARLRIEEFPLGQGSILALLRRIDERAKKPLLFSATGFTPGAVAVADSQDVALFTVSRRGAINPVNEVARTLGGTEAPLPADAKPPRPEPAEKVEWLPCPRCGATHHPKAHFCAACGTSLDAVPEPRQASDIGSAPVSSAEAPTLVCRNCGSHDIDLIRPG